MTEEESSGWNAWFLNGLDQFERDRLIPILESVADELGAVTGKAAREQDLRIAALEERVKTLEGLLMSKGVNVIELHRDKANAA